MERQRFDAHGSTTMQMSTELLRYWQAGEALLAHTPQFLTIAPDKSRVLGRTLSVSAIITNDNIGIWAFPVVRCLAHGYGLQGPRIRSKRPFWRHSGPRPGPGIPDGNFASNTVYVKYGVRLFLCKMLDSHLEAPHHHHI